jgi:hypothetical protein
MLTRLQSGVGVMCFAELEGLVLKHLCTVPVPEEGSAASNIKKLEITLAVDRLVHGAENLCHFLSHCPKLTFVKISLCDSE